MKRWCGVFFAVAMATACSEYNREAVQDNNAGMALMRQGRLADARDKFQRAADADPKFDQPLYNLSLVHVRQQEWAPAAKRRNAVTTESPSAIPNAVYRRPILPVLLIASSKQPPATAEMVVECPHGNAT